MRNIITNLFHVIGIIFFIIVLWLLLELTGVAGGFRAAWNAAQHAAGH